MVPFDSVIEVFEGKSPRIQWITPITLGYLYTLTGVWWHFLLTVLAIGGARFSTNLTVIGREGNQSPADYMFDFIFTPRGILFQAVIGVPYLFALFYAPWKLYLEFSHTDLVLVGLAAAYGGLLTVVLEELLTPDPEIQ